MLSILLPQAALLISDGREQLALGLHLGHRLLLRHHLADEREHAALLVLLHLPKDVLAAQRHRHLPLLLLPDVLLMLSSLLGPLLVHQALALLEGLALLLGEACLRLPRVLHALLGRLHLHGHNPPPLAVLRLERELPLPLALFGGGRTLLNLALGIGEERLRRLLFRLRLRLLLILLLARLALLPLGPLRFLPRLHALTRALLAALALIRGLRRALSLEQLLLAPLLCLVALFRELPPPPRVLLRLLCFELHLLLILLCDLRLHHLELHLLLELLLPPLGQLLHAAVRGGSSSGLIVGLRRGDRRRSRAAAAGRRGAACSWRLRRWRSL